jgi:hypothetical protein
VLRIDPTAATSEVVRVLTLTGESQPTEGPGGPAIGVGAGDGDLWITIDATGEVIRVDVESLGDAIIADPGCSPAPQGSPL